MFLSAISPTDIPIVIVCAIWIPLVAMIAVGTFVMALIEFSRKSGDRTISKEQRLSRLERVLDRADLNKAHG